MSQKDDGWFSQEAWARAGKVALLIAVGQLVLLLVRR